MLLMKLPNMLRFIFSIFCFIASISLTAQEVDNAAKPPVLKSGIRIGVDLANYVFQIIDPSIQGFEVSVDYEWRENFYATLEGGYDKAIPQSDLYNYELNGTYGRLGFDYDILHNQEDLDIIYVGLRYGMAFYENHADNVQLQSYWGNRTVEISKEQLSAYWLEAVFGMKAELFFAKNVFIGWSIRGKVLLSGNNYNVLEPYVIPGFAKTDADVALGLTWSVFYNIPIKRK